MKLLNIPFIPQDSHAHEKLILNPLTIEPWKKDENLSCAAAFSISHFDQGIRLRFVVTEPFLKVRKRKVNGEVHKDNCVEFFIAFGDDGNYYNFEFNCLGSVKAAYGKSRPHRRFVPPDLLAMVADQISISMDNAAAGKGIRWDISVVLPVSVFYYSNKQALAGESCAVNFAKCGDSLPQPHFLSWVGLYTDQPDFHQPESFGKAIFEMSPG
ncbi:carbohydrate-binding family 9-like protein [Pedobacter antarcticus]|uniref:carbohydrate-binding family 9-like protein n=1 Tax=Pedobacter antarcticus TaxID=34086 RepID=UPI002930F6D2|nr:carbohydrate-binding family 9-like protein [Pedobacter antarcticus]